MGQPPPARVTSGAQVALGLPLASSVLQTGEAVVVLRGGERVVLAGFVERDDDDHPIRRATVPVPGPHGVVIGRATPVAPAAQVGLATCRPAVEYLVIVIVVAIPGVLGVRAPEWR